MISLDDLKYYLNITDSSQDEFLLKIIDMAVERINNLCRRNLNYGTRYDIIDGNGQNLLWIRNYPVEQITSIKYRKETGSFDHNLFEDGSISDNTYLDKLMGKLILLNSYVLPLGTSNIQIRYYAGFLDNAPDPANETPKDLKSIALLMSAELFLKSFQNVGEEITKRLGLLQFDHVIKGEGNESHRSFTYKDEDYENLLDKYKSLRV
ncbi:MAG: phage head-tail connector protein [Ignavibacteriae bacterium]|nr:phage head-tail connector protein [Ignavibacteriota bacterium]